MLTPSLPCFPQDLALCGSFNRSTIFSAMIAGFFGDISQPVVPSQNASVLPPMCVTTTGSPAAMDSRITLENPSSWERRTERSLSAGNTAKKSRNLFPHIQNPMIICMIAHHIFIRIIHHFLNVTPIFESHHNIIYV